MLPEQMIGAIRFVLTMWSWLDTVSVKWELNGMGLPVAALCPADLRRAGGSWTEMGGWRLELQQLRTVPDATVYQRHLQLEALSLRYRTPCPEWLEQRRALCLQWLKADLKASEAPKTARAVRRSTPSLG